MTEAIDALVLELVGELQPLLDVDELRAGVLVAYDRAVPSDWVSITEVGPGPEDVHGVMAPALTEEQMAAFVAHADQNPLIARFLATRDGRAYRFSDVVCAEQLHATDLYRAFYGPLGIEFQIAFVIDTSPGWWVAVVLSRHARDYSTAERDLLNRTRGHLIQLYRNAIAHTALLERQRAHANGGALVAPLRAAGLTARAAEVLSRVAHGQSSADVAVGLGISERTVGKHLQACYRTLGVTGRSQAAAAAWRCGETD